MRFRVWGLGVWGLGFGDWGGLMDWGVGFRVSLMSTGLA